MARSTYVYLVLGPRGPVVGFTVKHELVTWLRSNPLSEFMSVWRLRDGSAGYWEHSRDSGGAWTSHWVAYEPAPLDTAELLAE